MNDNIDHPVIKVASAWAAVGITSWAEAASAGTFFASALAAIYTFALLCEWFWKRVWRPLFARFGWFGLERAGLLGSDTNFAAVRSTAPGGRAEGLANLGSDPKNPADEQP